MKGRDYPTTVCSSNSSLEDDELDRVAEFLVWLETFITRYDIFSILECLLLVSTT